MITSGLWPGALGGTRTPSLQIRRCPYWRPGLFRPVRDLGLASSRCPGEFGASQGCSSAWLSEWLPNPLPELAPPLVGGLPGDAEPGADLGPGVPAAAQGRGSHRTGPRRRARRARRVRPAGPSASGLGPEFFSVLAVCGPDPRLLLTVVDAQHPEQPGVVRVAAEFPVVPHLLGRESQHGQQAQDRGACGMVPSSLDFLSVTRRQSRRFRKCCSKTFSDADSRREVPNGCRRSCAASFTQPSARPWVRIGTSAG